MKTKKKLAIVTGGGSGIGFAIAEAFVQSDIHTIIVGRDQEKLRAACDRLGSNCNSISCDLTQLDKIPSVVSGIIAEYGHIDILVNNAGINMKKAFIEVTDQDFQGILQTNVTAVFSFSREVVKHQLSKGIKGVVINISSMASQYGIPKVIAYTASKAAIEGMTRAMATELSPHGIRINCIAPGFIATDMSARALDADPERKSKAIGRTPMGYLGQPSDIGAAALFLASDTAKYITGVILPVDGGNAVGF
ncbi:SDR family NAD(P)-dependent oxidoreductase [Chitinophaga rhizophila]|uniref:SDR family oxidoreductase n=1 Tax=Chitinophaga rhizophila TaxID=2866212 RepID=A0ABS7GI59_9BACT|nr:SDR family oxidoreductase [Chitinophaga rhizophila]MBW8687386.1 SDR family oxidoreductase [Chitinophaga rhizophila]